MADNITECPNCKEGVRAGKICDNCGLNIQTGETYEMRVRKTKGAKDLQPPLTGRLGILTLAAFGFILLAGFMYQRRTAEIIRAEESMFRGYIERSEEVDILLAAGEEQRAAGIGEELLTELEDRLDNLEANGTLQTLLENFIAKTERRLDKISVDDNAWD